MTMNEAIDFVNSLPPESIDKLLNDHLIGERALKLTIRHTVTEVVSQMHPLELKALLKRISPPLSARDQARTEGRVTWQVEGALVTGKPTLIGRCSRCGGDAAFTGTPQGARELVWAHCLLGPSRPPAEIVREYEQKIDTRM